MRFMEFLKLKCVPRTSVWAEGQGIAEAFTSIHEVRAVLCALFDVSRFELARAAREAVRNARTQLVAAAAERAAPSGSSSIEQQMKRAGIDTVFRRVEFLTQRRGLRLRDVGELMDTDSCGVLPIAKIVAFMQAISLRNPPPSYEAARLKNAEKAAEAATQNAARQKEEIDFTIRMRAAEESGCFASFAMLDRYFCRYQLRAEDIWFHGRKRRAGFEAVGAGPRDEDADALDAVGFHKLLQVAKVSLSLEQATKLVDYLDTNDSGKIEHHELQAAMLDYRRFKRAKQRLELKRASAERRLFLDRQVLLLLQYLVLVGTQPKDDGPSSWGAAKLAAKAEKAAAAVAAAAAAEDDRDDGGRDTVVAKVPLLGPNIQLINVVEMQRSIEKSGHLAISQYFREVRERLHTDAYTNLRELRADA
jgi:hypothetical protein